MKTLSLHPLKAFLVVLGLFLSTLALGCAEDNNATFLKEAPPGPKDEHLGESVADRRARTRRLSKNELKIEARRKADAEKAEKKAAAEKAK